MAIRYLIWLAAAVIPSFLILISFFFAARALKKRKVKAIAIRKRHAADGEPSPFSFARARKGIGRRRDKGKQEKANPLSWRTVRKGQKIPGSPATTVSHLHYLFENEYGLR